MPSAVSLQPKLLLRKVPTTSRCSRMHCTRLGAASMQRSWQRFHRPVAWDFWIEFNSGSSTKHSLIQPKYWQDPNLDGFTIFYDLYIYRIFIDIPMSERFIMAMPPLVPTDQFPEICYAWEAPYRWRHACLSQLQDFLRQERDAGRYHPLITEGLDWWNQLTYFPVNYGVVVSPH